MTSPYTRCMFEFLNTIENTILEVQGSEGRTGKEYRSLGLNDREERRWGKLSRGEECGQGSEETLNRSQWLTGVSSSGTVALMLNGSYFLTCKIRPLSKPGTCLPLSKSSDLHQAPLTLVIERVCTCEGLALLDYYKRPHTHTHNQHIIVTTLFPKSHFWKCNMNTEWMQTGTHELPTFWLHPSSLKQWGKVNGGKQEKAPFRAEAIDLGTVWEGEGGGGHELV